MYIYIYIYIIMPIDYKFLYKKQKKYYLKNDKEKMNMKGGMESKKAFKKFFNLNNTNQNNVEIFLDNFIKDLGLNFNEDESIEKKLIYLEEHFDIKKNKKNHMIRIKEIKDKKFQFKKDLNDVFNKIIEENYPTLHDKLNYLESQLDEEPNCKTLAERLQNAQKELIFDTDTEIDDIDVEDVSKEINSQDVENFFVDDNKSN